MSTFADRMGRMAELQELALSHALTDAQKAELLGLEDSVLTSHDALMRGDALITSSELAADPFDQAELRSLLDAAHGDEVVEALVRAAHRDATGEETVAMPMVTYAWTAEGDLEVMGYRSQARACMAALTAAVDADARALLARTRRFVVQLPTVPLDPELAAEHGVPTDREAGFTAARALLDRWLSQYEDGAKRPAFKMMPCWNDKEGTDLVEPGPVSPERRAELVGKLEDWEVQRAAVLLRLELELERRRLTPVDATVVRAARHATVDTNTDGSIRKVYTQRVDGLEEILVTGVDRALVGEGGAVDDIAKLPYMSLQFSTAGVDRHSGRADYRRVFGVYEGNESLDLVSRILGHGRWEQDGASYAVPADPGHPAWDREFQMRARQSMSDIAKGVAVPLDPDYVRSRIKVARRRVIDLFSEAKALDAEAGKWTRVAYAMRHTTPDKAWGYVAAAKQARADAYTAELRAYRAKRITEQGVSVLERALRAADRGTDALFLAKGDQVKVGSGAVKDGPTWLAGTYLRGRTYDMAFNTQGIQLLSNEATAELGRFVHRVVQEQCYFPLLTPEGIAQVVDEGIGRIRVIDGLADPEAGEEANEKRLQETVDNLDTLRTLLLSGAVRHTTEAQQARIEGRAIPEGGVRVPGASALKMLDMIWASLVREVLRSWGITMKGGLLLTSEDSVSRARFLWGLEPERFGYNGLLRPGRFVEETDENGDTVYAWKGGTTTNGGGGSPLFFVPKSFVRALNGDNDGDLVAGIGSDVTLACGRVVKLVLVMRYPCIDPPVLWALPAGTPTPWDAVFTPVVTMAMTRTEVLEKARSLFGKFPKLSRLGLDTNLPAQRTASGARKRARVRYNKARMVEVVNEIANPQWSYYKQFLGVFGATVRDDQDLFGDVPVHCDSRLVQLRKDGGIKSQFEVEKLTGSITPRAAMDMCYRKCLLQWTGPYTRKHERLAVRMAHAFSKAERAKSPKAKASWTRQANEFRRRLATNGIAIEEQVTSFKKKLFEETRSPGLFLYSKDLTFSDKREPAEVISIDYHARIKGLTHVLDRFAGRNEGASALESMGYFGPLTADGQPDPRWVEVVGKETAILNRLLETGLADTVRALDSVRTELYPYVVELDRMTESFDLGDRADEVEDERQAALAQLDSWRTFWVGEEGEMGVMDRYYEILETAPAGDLEEAEKRAGDFLRQAAQVKKAALRQAGAQLSTEALVMAVADHWSEDGEEVELADGRTFTSRVNATPAIALLSERVCDVFPLRRVGVTASLRASKAITVYTTGADLRAAGFDAVPGEPGEAMDVRSLVFERDGGLFLAEHDAGDGTTVVLPWRLADGQALPDVDPARLAHRRIVPVSGNRAVVYV